MRVILSAAGLLSEDVGRVNDAGSFVEKDALLVYAGTFKSLDGEVEITSEHIDALAAQHNGIIKQFAQSVMPMKFCPPVQIDHSASAKDTVGRLIGPVTIGEHEGKPALYGKIKILGKENVEKVLDGRWTHLSIGADLDTGKFTEITITPFPAASDASLLSSGLAEVETVYYGVYKNQPFTIKKAANKFFWQCGLTRSQKPHDNEQSAMEHLKEWVEKNNQMKGNQMTKEEMKKHLIEAEKMSEEEADKKLSTMTDEQMCKMAEEIKAKKLTDGVTKDQEVKKEEIAKMTALKEGVTRLAAQIKEAGVKVSLAQRKSAIHIRLASLQAAAKISPAEVKKQNVNELASLDEKALEQVFKTFDNREPVLFVGMYGDANAVALSQIREKQAESVRLARLEVESRKNMGMPVSDELKKMAEIQVPEQAGDTKIHIDTTPHTHQDFESAWDEVKKLMAEGKEDEAKEKMKKLLSMVTTKEQALSEGVEAEVKTMEEEIKNLQAQISELTKLVV